MHCYPEIVFKSFTESCHHPTKKRIIKVLESLTLTIISKLTRVYFQYKNQNKQIQIDTSVHRTIQKSAPVKFAISILARLSCTLTFARSAILVGRRRVPTCWNAWRAYGVVIKPSTENNSARSYMEHVWSAFFHVPRRAAILRYEIERRPGASRSQGIHRYPARQSRGVVRSARQWDRYWDEHAKNGHV